MNQQIKITITFLFSLIFYLKNYGQVSNNYLKFTINNLIEQQKETGENDFIFLNESTLKGEFVYLNKNEIINHTAKYDMIGYIIDGNGKLHSQNNVFSLRKGFIFFIPRDSVYSFYDVATPLHIIELFSLGRMKNMDNKIPVPKTFTLYDAEKERLPGENVWNDFLKQNSMIFGLYMLPKIIGGDSALMHKWDEVNLLINGTGKFQVGNRIMDVKPGDIIYVKKGNPHFFHSLQSNLDILIFFEMKSMEN